MITSKTELKVANARNHQRKSKQYTNMFLLQHPSDNNAEFELYGDHFAYFLHYCHVSIVPYRVPSTI